ncbi:hypothetical protein [Kineosporia babensis]|uniref:WXG100 family type VII secretion target n=1 Tax=Kineosporia babensis TaxID=499548 RepID=A0A9X1NMQ6_9ACTN|nr:hypothetical protein [Kineosporia babensis]MCD5315933.1 hypothetical protein [Kineosporia babensis]
MAEMFRANVQAAGDTARRVADVRSTFNGLDAIFAGEGAATGSPRIQQALGNFVDSSSDLRKRLDESLERAAGLLTGLAEGAGGLDRGLAEAIEVEAPATS